ncbi:hypothetical protein RSE72_002784 [Yersinia enterocolitica]|nr:hypothetical protein [Yersinia enterocolitica]ELX2216697.1 hypothetical protein [Yersinia enterocolitica]
MINFKKNNPLAIQITPKKINAILILLLSLTSLDLLANMPQPIVTPPKEILNINQLLQFTALTKDIINIIFFIIAGTVTILSFIQAKKTVFSPIKTEVFKLQLGVFNEIINNFQKKGISELEDDIDIQKILFVNTEAIKLIYIKQFYPEKIVTINKIHEILKANHVGMRIDFEKMKGKIKPVSFNNYNIENEQEDTLLNWSEFEPEAILLTQKHLNYINILSEYQNSPLIPSKLKLILKNYENSANSCINNIAEALTKAGRHIGEEKRSFETIVNMDCNWIINIYNSNRVDLEDEAKKILNYISDYFETEKIVENR